MRSPGFLNQSDADKFGQIGQALNSMQMHNFRMDRLVSDLSHQYSKYCLRMSGDDLPKSDKGEDCIAIWIEGMRQKFAIQISEDERMQFRACHRVSDGSIMAAFTTSIAGSVFDRCAYRGDRKDGKGSNWNGERNQGEGRNLKVSVDRVASKADSSIQSAGLHLKRKDKDRPQLERRVVQVKISRSGAVIFRNGKGDHQMMYHVQEALEIMTEEERKEFAGSITGPRGIRDGQRNNRGGCGRGRGGRAHGDKNAVSGDSMQMQM